MDKWATARVQNRIDPVCAVHCMRACHGSRWIKAQAQPGKHKAPTATAKHWPGPIPAFAPRSPPCYCVTLSQRVAVSTHTTSTTVVRAIYEIVLSRVSGPVAPLSYPPRNTPQQRMRRGLASRFSYLQQVFASPATVSVSARRHARLRIRTVSLSRHCGQAYVPHLPRNPI